MQDKIIQLTDLARVARGGENFARELMELAQSRNILVKRVPRARLDRDVGNTHHQGVMARVAGARYADVDDLLTSIQSRVGSEVEPLIVVLDGVEDPRNLGAILRTATNQ